ncbi:MAG: UvrD-helicase domain-containing protein [Gemmatimonadota bacterium]|nr:UvrD-helicase domain-containing protein [Gemmatimonadota bacterium]MDE2985758.1 UvrD-helicase domain-containing protein [Gemmatimonadota bacterium]
MKRARELSPPAPPPPPRREPPDQAARHRIVEDLERNLLVEAGAGSGKTTSLVDRMVALVRSRACTVDRIAAVTFTRKAAAELRQKFQVRLEEVAAPLAPDDPGHEVLQQAIRDIDLAFLGTIHAFCARLLRERPLEAGLDPGFHEVQESEAERMERRFWVEFLERLATDGDPRLGELEQLGIQPDRLEDAFRMLVENPDVDFGFEPVDPPDPEELKAVRGRFEELLDRAERLMRGRRPADGWDSFGRRVRTLLYWRRSLDWSDQSAFFDALARVHLKKGGLIQKRWADSARGKAAAKHLFANFVAFARADGAADRVLREWWAYRYPVAIGVARDAAAAFARQRKDRGETNFQDLLVHTAALLRDDPPARRDLGRRYQRVLVDEFQDTDPLQAEVLLLLASDPETGNDWRTVTPRPGALFVVGDPKQSIYRFRRADIALYEVVRKRFEYFGDVLLLEANFRSLPAIETLVKGVFDHEDRFGSEDTDRQAKFAPLLTQRGEGPGVLAAYTVAGGRQDEVAGDEAARIATEIARRVEAGEREPADFMILTRTRKYLPVYAHALEDRNLPVEVSGAGVGFEEELAALLLLFRCLEDPAHQTRVLGVLAGPLFGITLDRLVAYRDGGGRFAVNAPAEGDDEVAEAINLLHGWWKRARRDPADVTAERLVGEIGLFPLAAAGKLGGLRAGALAYLLDAVRARAMEGDSSIAGAVDAVTTALEWEDAEAPLVPGRGNGVQVMNLHRAKGLEAKVVFLAAPFGESRRPPRMRVARDEDGLAQGTIPLTVTRGFTTEIIAQPGSWEEDKAVESEFEEAEKVRLLYVAATRARDELWIGRGAGLGKRNKSPWAVLEGWVTGAAAEDGGGMAGVVELPREDPPAPDVLDAGTDMSVAIAEMAAAAERTREPTYRLDTVTGRVKGAGGVVPVRPDPPIRVEDFTQPLLDPASGGFEWGSVVHAVLAAAGEGMRGEPLAQLARDLLIELERPVDSTGAPTELQALLALVDAVRGSAVWRRAMESGERYTEVPFAVNLGGNEGAPEVLEGVIDLVFREDGHWVLADYKTDSGEDPEFEERVGRYRAQVDLYGDCWERLTGEVVGERVLVFTAQGRVEGW